MGAVNRQFHMFGEPVQREGISLHEERRGTGSGPARRYRLLINGAVVVLSSDQLFDLADVTDEMCEIVEEEEQNVG